MSQIRKKLSMLQWNIVLENDKELQQLKNMMQAVEQKQKIIIGLILDFHGITQGDVKIDSNTQELVITSDNI